MAPQTAGRKPAVLRRQRSFPAGTEALSYRRLRLPGRKAAAPKRRAGRVPINRLKTARRHKTAPLRSTAAQGRIKNIIRRLRKGCGFCRSLPFAKAAPSYFFSTAMCTSLYSSMMTNIDSDRPATISHWTPVMATTWKIP